MFNRLKAFMKSNYFISASLIYIIGAFLLRGISFLTIPIFTRILKPNDFGIISVFSTWVTFFAVFISGQVSGSIATARVHLTPERFKGYLRNIMILAILFATFTIFISAVFYKQLMVLLQMEAQLIPHLLLQAFGSSMSTLYATYLVQTKQPKKNIIFAVAVSVVTVVLGISFVLNFEHNKYMGKIIAGSITNGAIIGFILTVLLRISKGKVDLSDWKYCIRLSSPLIIHLLANIAIGQSSRLIIHQLLGSTEAGIYYVAHGVGVLGMIFADACNNAWSPWYLDHTKSGENETVNMFAQRYIIVIGSAFIMILLVAPEILKIMAPEPYWSSTKTIIIISVSVFFQFLYRFPLAYEQYSKNLKWVAACTITTAILNVGLNYLFIPVFGMEGAGWAALGSFLTLFAFHELVARKIIKGYNIRFSAYIPSIIACCIFAIIAYLLIDFWYIRLACIFIYGILFFSWIKQHKFLRIFL